MLVELQCYWELLKTDIFMFGTPFIPLAKIHCFLETNKFLSKKNGFIQAQGEFSVDCPRTTNQIS